MRIPSMKTVIKIKQAIKGNKTSSINDESKECLLIFIGGGDTKNKVICNIEFYRNNGSFRLLPIYYVH